MPILKRPVLDRLPVLTTACTTSGMTSIPNVPHVDLPRCMRDWYVIAHIPSFIERKAPDYSQTIVGRGKRDYAWFMARSPQMAEAEYAGLPRRLTEIGYDASKVRRVPHSTGS